MSATFRPHVRTAIATAHAALRDSKHPTTYLVEQVVSALDTAGLLMHPEAAAEIRDAARGDADEPIPYALTDAAHGAPVVKLTRMQRAVISGAAQGEQPRETAARLVLTGHTIRSHKRRAFKALGARSIAQAAVLADRAGLLDAVTAERGAES